jgi:hypothetical protein
MRFDLNIKRLLTQFGKDARGMPDANRSFTRSQQPFEDIIDGKITRSTGKDSLTASDRLANQLDNCGRFASSWRTMDNGDIVRRQRMADRLPLRIIQARSKTEV